MTTLDALLGPDPATRPLRIVAVREFRALHRVCAAHGIDLIDVKRLEEEGGLAEGGILRHAARALGHSGAAPQDNQWVYTVAERLVMPGPRALLARVPDAQLPGLLGSLCGVGRLVSEYLTTWTGPPRLVLALTPPQATRSWVSPNESSVFDFAEPAGVAFPDGLSALPNRPATLEAGVRAFLQAVPRVDEGDLQVVLDWPAFAPSDHGDLVEDLPRRLLRSFIATGRDSDNRRRRAWVSQIFGANRDDLHGDSPARSLTLRCLSTWLLPPKARHQRVIDEGLFGQYPLYRVVLVHGCRTELDELLVCDDLFGDSSEALAGLVTWLGSEPVVHWDALLLPSKFSLKDCTPADLARIQLAAALETTYRLRLVRAHKLPRAALTWTRATDQIATYLALAVLFALREVWPNDRTPSASDIAPPTMDGEALRELPVAFKRSVDALPAQLRSDQRGLPAALLARALRSKKDSA